MHKVMKHLLLLAILAASIVSFASCSSLNAELDVVAKGAKTSFAALREAIPDYVTEDPQQNAWVLSAPDGTARFIWSSNWSQSAVADAFLEFDVQPFLDAGLDAAKIPDSIIYENGTFRVGRDFGDTVSEGESTPQSTFDKIVDHRRDVVSYHTQMDHYGIDLGNGNMLEWAKDLSINDKDLVFVLNPEPFIAAGVDPNAVEGWTFAKVTVGMGADEKQVDKFLKPFNLN